MPQATQTYFFVSCPTKLKHFQSVFHLMFSASKRYVSCLTGECSYYKEQETETRGTLLVAERHGSLPLVSFSSRNTCMGQALDLQCDNHSSKIKMEWNAGKFFRLYQYFTFATIVSL